MCFQLKLDTGYICKYNLNNDSKMLFPFLKKACITCNALMLLTDEISNILLLETFFLLMNETGQ